MGVGSGRVLGQVQRVSTGSVYCRRGSSYSNLAWSLEQACSLKGSFQICLHFLCLKKLASEGRSRSWNLQFCLVFMIENWRVYVLFLSFFILICRGVRGMMTWKLTRYGVFNVGCYYYLLSGPLTEVFPRKSI